ncbi:hypothetical protein P3X46_010803 [Hevea brasiliensis]|uniref:F-box domain-containing protein n=1 Tax=Hevea brasiliensis TaxID=3981 RepID=A0ABQ9MHX2_HEVBR|nr:F-box/kelch-repeat protein At3g23880 isoform X2 [Hevea brasiliensis]KAJ9178963.1 hypothetical protein P3X46_010803 [Hevea brasiliensis]
MEDANHPKSEIPFSQLSCNGMENAKRKKAGLFLNFPEDLLCDILLRLPLSSLLRFKAVNRCWHSLISSHGFAIGHLNYQANNAEPSPRKYGVIQVSNIPQQQLPRLSLYMHRKAEEEDSDVLIVQTVGFPNPLLLLEDFKNINDSQVFGSCNGLLLLGHGKNPKRFILWNPSTGQDKELPLNHFCECPTTFMAGLGYDSFSDNYKVLAAVNDGGSQLTYVAVYNLKTNSWAMLEKTVFPYEFSSDSSQPGITLANGAPHWVLKRRGTGHVANVIIYFDLVQENFKELPLPGRLVGAKNVFLGACKGSLCVGSLWPVNSQIWIMNQYGVKESWTMLMLIPGASSTYSILNFQHLMSMQFPKKSIVLMILDGNSAALFKNKVKESNSFSFSGCQEGLIITAYMESLISPNNYG